jgi:hypothetical protein
VIRSVGSTELHVHLSPYTDTGETFACERMALAVVSQRLRSQARHGTGSQLVYMCRNFRRLQIVSVGARVGVLLAYTSIPADEWDVMGVSAIVQ